MEKIGFDTEKYIKAETKAIIDRVKKFDKIYLEFGGHLLKDHHASRVLPGYKKDNKLNILSKLKKDVEIIYCVYSKQIVGDQRDYNTGIEFEDLVIKEVKELKKNKFKIAGVVITRFLNQRDCVIFQKRLEEINIKVYYNYPIKEYPDNLKIILGDEGYSKQPYIETKEKIIIVTSPESNSGKMGVCLSQIYHDNKNKINSGYSKLETFPIWNLPLNHPVNLAYEASTADVGDFNQIDPYHKKAYNKIAVNYNRDIENFKILKKIIDKIVSKNNYMHNFKSPTDMGINMVKKGITNLKVIESASVQEVMKRNVNYIERHRQRLETKKTIKRMQEIIKKI